MKTSGLLTLNPPPHAPASHEFNSYEVIISIEEIDLQNLAIEFNSSEPVLSVSSLWSVPGGSLLLPVPPLGVKSFRVLFCRPTIGMGSNCKIRANRKQPQNPVRPSPDKHTAHTGRTAAKEWRNSNHHKILLVFALNI